jgi:oxysterol-binding protein-related protein 8
LDSECHRVSSHRIIKMQLLISNRDGKDPREMTEQILAIAPILPGQKMNPEFEIPPHASTLPTRTENNQKKDQQPAAPTPSPGNDLIDFESSAPNAKAVAANNVPSQYRTRSMSLMDDDRHVNTMNEKMGKTHVMEPTKTPATSPTGKGQPLERTDTHTSEVDAFFDAEG